ncbi:MAG: MgtC/SapB family protein, partial [Chloroflexi bacterium]|nr:MgtC/SapB family protein [Chloroflexota bacterium]
MQQRGSVQGLTAATAIWLAASLGLAAATGMCVAAIGATVLAVVVLECFPRRPAAARGHAAATASRGL